VCKTVNSQCVAPVGSFKICQRDFPYLSYVRPNSCHLLVMGLEQRFLCHLRSTRRWVSQLMFFEMRHAAAPAFKRTYIGQCAETLRPSNQSHVPSAAWAQRQLRLRAFSIRDEARFSAIHARLHWLSLLVEHSLADSLLWKRVSTRSKLARKREPMARSSTTNEWATGLLPHITTSVTSGCGRR
jgi:hypothetical protein